MNRLRGNLEGDGDMSTVRKKKKTRVSPIYAIALTWIALSALFPPYSIMRAALIAAVSVGVFFGVSNFLQQKYGDEYEEETEQSVGQNRFSSSKPDHAEAKEEKKVSYGKEIDDIIAEGERAQKELGRLYASIPDIAVKAKIRDIMEVSDKIINDAKADPTDVPQIKKFLDYYLPTTIKLLEVYDRMGQQGIEGENISGTMHRIEDMLDTAVKSYNKLLDGLFANQAMDIETDISVMNTLLRREGLLEEGSFGK